MTNDEKIKEIAEKEVHPIIAERCALEMAKWKDQQHAKECESLVGLAVKEARQVFVDKACEIVRDLANEHFGDWEQSCKFENAFRKAMESEGNRIEIPFVQVPESETAKLETSDITNLTWQDMARIADIMGHTRRLTEEGFTRKPEEFYTEVLKKFKEK